MVDGGELPSLSIDGGDWFSATPPAAVPVPAATMVGNLTALSAMVTRPNIGVLTDMRVFGEATAVEGVLYADLLSEHDFWRSRLHPGTAVPALRVPLDRVWVEHRLDPPAAQPAQEAPASGDLYDVWRRLSPGPDVPGARIPRPARGVSHLHGRRIIQVTPIGYAWNLRAISEPYDLDGEITVMCTAAEDYYSWIIDGSQPEAVPLPLYLLWCE